MGLLGNVDQDVTKVATPKAKDPRMLPFPGKDNPIDNQLPWAPKWQTQDLSESNPLPWQKYLDQGAIDIANDIFANARQPRTPANLQLSGWGASGDPNALKTGDFGEAPVGHDKYTDDLLKGVEMGAPTGGSPMSDAISRKYQRETESNIGNLRRQIEQNAPMTQAKQLARAADIYGKQQAIRMQNFKEQYEFQQRRAQLYAAWKQAKDAGSASIFSAVLGGIGAVGGFIVGGPAGAAAGYAGGSAAGAAIGS